MVTDSPVMGLTAEEHPALQRTCAHTDTDVSATANREQTLPMHFALCHAVTTSHLTLRAIVLCDHLCFPGEETEAQRE